MSTRTISDSVETYLLALGAPTSTEDGWRSLSAAYYNSSSSNSDATIEIPEFIDSIETLKFIGFCDEAAEKTWHNFCVVRERVGSDASLIHIAKNRVRRGHDAFEANHDWDLAMASMGIGPALRARILTPGYEDIRFSQTAEDWVIESNEDRYEFLKSLGDWITTPQHGSQRSTTAEGLELERSHTPAGPASPAKFPLLRTFEHPSQPRVRSLSNVLAVGDDEMILMKGGSLARLKKAQSLEKNQLQVLFSRPFGNLSEFPAYYFTKQAEVARKYAMYTRTRNNGDVVPAGILYLVIPKALMAEAVPIVGLDFKRFVWHNRLQQRLPNHLEYYTQAHVLIGPLIWKSSESIAEMQGHGLDWQALEPLRIHNGEAATQYCVTDNRLINQMNKEGRVCVTAYKDPS